MNEKEYAKIVAKNLRRIAYEHGKTQLQISEDLHIHKATISAWMNGTRTPKMSKVDLLCEYFGVRRSDIMEPYNPNKTFAFSHIRIPVLGHVAAGVPIESIQDIIDWEEISPELAASGQFYGLKVKGSSMEPRIMEGDVLIVRCQPDAENGDVVIVQVNGDSATCKKIKKHEKGITLISFNPSYDPMVFTQEDIEKLPVRIIGKVIENRQKY